LGVLSYWTNSYWRGAVPAIGGALVMGAIRLYRVRDAILFAAGLSLLANSRPLEGSVLCISAILLLIIVFGSKNPTGIKNFVCHIVSVPVVLITFIFILFIC
jgi:hypothetical protein